MIGGRGFWIFVWYCILALGLIGLWASILWGRRLKWQNLDEFLRAIGTVQVSAGMLMLLYGVAVQVATGLLGLAFGVFVAAFVAGRNAIQQEHRRHDDPEPEPGGESEPEAERDQSLPVQDRSA